MHSPVSCDLAVQTGRGLQNAFTINLRGATHYTFTEAKAIVRIFTLDTYHCGYQAQILSGSALTSPSVFRSLVQCQDEADSKTLIRMSSGSSSPVLEGDLSWLGLYTRSLWTE